MLWQGKQQWAAGTDPCLCLHTCCPSCLLPSHLPCLPPPPLAPITCCPHCCLSSEQVCSREKQQQDQVRVRAKAEDKQQWLTRGRTKKGVRCGSHLPGLHSYMVQQFQQLQELMPLFVCHLVHNKPCSLGPASGARWVWEPWFRAREIDTK